MLFQLWSGSMALRMYVGVDNETSNLHGIFLLIPTYFYDGRNRDSGYGKLFRSNWKESVSRAPAREDGLLQRTFG